MRCGEEVIRCAGAVKSPYILELSGIGRPELLQSLGIEVKHALPGVGENYRDCEQAPNQASFRKRTQRSDCVAQIDW